jgi:hypothetical protein
MELNQQLGVDTTKNSVNTTNLLLFYITATSFPMFSEMFGEKLKAS